MNLPTWLYVRPGNSDRRSAHSIDGLQTAPMGCSLVHKYYKESYNVAWQVLEG